jgi:adenosylcobalamin-dependent ribonucleoside-triphosphate reductase
VRSVSTDEATTRKFKLSKSFVEKYKNKKPPFGFNGLGEFVYRRTYSRVKSDGHNEQWWETVERVVNGTYTMQRRWIEQHGLGWQQSKAQRSAQEMYDRIWQMKFLPPGRGLWAMGSPLTEERGTYAALNNCAFVSTAELSAEPTKPFVFLMDMSMLGVGVGFDTRGAGKVTVKGPREGSAEEHVIDDTREGWVDSMRRLLSVYLEGNRAVQFDYSRIRPAGAPIKGFGGVASGPAALQRLHQSIANTLQPLIGTTLGVRGIVDIMNHIGRCVVAGNVRQTAEIAFGPADNEEYLDLKNYAKHPERMEYGWTSNNSVFAELGMNYAPVTSRVQLNGEPGFAWLDNMRAYGRMNELEKNWKDERAMGGNPCLEQTLESYELCCLVETFPFNHDSLEDYVNTLKCAYLYAKTVTLGQTHWPESNRVMLRNRRIGCSVSGVAQFTAKHGIGALQHWLTQGYAAIQRYDQSLSEWMVIPRSIKTTSVKPSGTVSLLAGATPGLHWPISRYYKRRVRVSKHSDLLPVLQSAGYAIEPSVDDAHNTLVVTFPVDVGAGVRPQHQVSMWEQLSMASFLQRYWADNQVSATITFDPATEGPQLTHALDYFQYQLKGVSFLPRSDGVYAQMPYEEISAEEYAALVQNLQPLNLTAVNTKPQPDKFCDSDVCGIGPNVTAPEDSTENKEL